MSEQSSKSGAPYPLLLIAGVAFIIAGSYLYLNPPAFTHTLEEMGIPLDIGKSLGTIGIFLIVFPAIKFFYVQPLQDAIQGRNSELESTFAEADSLRNEMTKMKTEYEARLADTESKARAQIQEQIKEAQTLRSTLMAEASSRADDLLRKANDEIATERDRVMTDLRLKTVDLTLAATERLIGQNLDDDRNRKLVQEFIDKMEVPS